MKLTRTAYLVSIGELPAYHQSYLLRQFAICIFVQLIERQKYVLALLLAKLISHYNFIN